jgi:hypothetical protein
MALPFLLAKRDQLPEPRRGQKEFDLFTELTGGSTWYDDIMVETDNEYKITEFDYENYLNPELLKDIDTSSKEFRDQIRLLNLFSKTKYERLQDQKEAFKHLMPILKDLDENEVRVLLHKLENRTFQDIDNKTDMLDRLTQSTTEKQFAKLSEEENFKAKNRYKLQRDLLDFIDKKRMPIDKSKVIDMLRF